MAVLPNERGANDMTKTGQYCPRCPDEQMEVVSSEATYTCHNCGRVEIRVIREGKITFQRTEFEGT